MHLVLARPFLLFGVFSTSRGFCPVVLGVAGPGLASRLFFLVCWAWSLFLLVRWRLLLSFALLLIVFVFFVGCLIGSWSRPLAGFVSPSVGLVIYFVLFLSYLTSIFVLVVHVLLVLRRIGACGACAVYFVSVPGVGFVGRRFGFVLPYFSGPLLSCVLWSCCVRVFLVVGVFFSLRRYLLVVFCWCLFCWFAVGPLMGMLSLVALVPGLGAQGVWLACLLFWLCGGW